MRLARIARNIETPGPFTRRHVFSEFNGPWEDFTPDERGKLIETIYSNADLTGMRIVAISIGPREFELILDVPDSLELGREEMLARLESYRKSSTHRSEVIQTYGDSEEERERLGKRFGDLGIFMKHVKQLCTNRYHAVHSSRGTIWTSRYIDLFVQDGLHSQILTAWMDHAGVRAGEITDPSADPFSTFGLACGGDKRARRMIAELFGGGKSWPLARKNYEAFIADTTPPPGKPRRSQSGQPPLLDRQALLNAHVPHFRGGLVFGDEDFCAKFIAENQSFFPENRAFTGRPITGQNDPRLCTVRQKRDLRKPRK